MKYQLIITLLFMSNYIIGQRAIGNSTQQVVGVSRIELRDSTIAVRGDFPNGIQSVDSSDIKTFGAIYGDIDLLYPQLSVTQRNNIRKANWTAFKQACNDAILKERTVIVSKYIEIYTPNYLDQVNLGDGDKLYIKGGSELRTTMSFFPKTYNIDYNFHHGKSIGWRLFEVLDECSLIIQNIDFDFLDSRFMTKVQTYKCILKYNNNVRQIKIQDTVQVYSKLWQYLVPNTIVYYDHGLDTDPGVNGGGHAIVQSVDSVNRIITLTTDILNTVTNNESGVDVVLGFDFPIDITPNVDTINRYGVGWMLNRSNQKIFTSNGTVIPGKSDYGSLQLLNCRFNNLANVGNFANIGRKIIIKDCEFRGVFEVGVQGGGDGIHAQFIMDNSFVTNCGSYQRYEAYNNGWETGGSTWGSAFYLSTTISVVVTNTHFIDNVAATFRQFSDSSPDSKWTAYKYVQSYFENCKFERCGEYHLLTSRLFRTVLNSCTFDSTNVVHIENSLDAYGCYFGGSYDMYSYNHPQDNYYDGYNIRFNSCTFGRYSNGVLNAWNGVENTRTSLVYDNCTFGLAGTNDPANYPYKLLFSSSSEGAENYGMKVAITNCFLRLQDTILYSNIQNFMNTMSFNGQILIDNLRPVNELDRSYSLSQFCTSRSVATLSQYPYRRNITVRNSDVKIFGKFFDGYAHPYYMLTVENTLHNASFNTQQPQYRILLPNKSTVKAITSSVTIDDVVKTKVLEGDVNNNTYYVSGDTLKFITIIGKRSNDKLDMTTCVDKIKVIPTNNMTLKPYGVSSSSNIFGTTSETLTAGVIYEFESVQIGCLGASSTKVDTITIVANGSQDKFSTTWLEGGQKQIIPGTILVTAPGISETTTDIYGVFNTVNLQGIVYPYSTSSGNAATYYLDFTATPSAGNINIYYTRPVGCVTKGFWVKK